MNDSYILQQTLKIKSTALLYDIYKRWRLYDKGKSSFTKNKEKGEVCPSHTKLTSKEKGEIFASRLLKFKHKTVDFFVRVD